MMPYGVEHPLGQLGSALLAASPPSLPHTPQASMRNRKALDFLATAKTISMLSTLFSSQIQNRAPHQPPGRKLTLSQPKPGQTPTRETYPAPGYLRTRCKACLFRYAVCTIQDYASASLRNMHKQRHATPFQAQGFFFFHKPSRGHILQHSTLEAGFMESCFSFSPCT